MCIVGVHCSLGQGFLCVIIKTLYSTVISYKARTAFTWMTKLTFSAKEIFNSKGDMFLRLYEHFSV